MAETKASKAVAKTGDRDDVGTEEAKSKTAYGTKLTSKDGPVYVTLINGTHLGAGDLKVVEMDRDDDGFGVYVVTELKHATGPRVRRMWIPYTNVASIWQDVNTGTDENTTPVDTAE